MYLDTSAAVKLYLPERESEALHQSVSDQNALSSSELLVAEMASALAGKARIRLLPRREQNWIWQTFAEHVKSGYWSLMPLSAAECWMAAELVQQGSRRFALRAMDALHLAICKSYKLFPLCTFDQKMLRAARWLEIPVREIPV